MTIPQMSAQWRLRSVCAPVQSDQSLRCTSEDAFWSLATQRVPSKDADQTARCTYDFVGFVMIQLKLHDWPRLLKFRQCTAKLAKLLRLRIPAVWSNFADRSVDPKLLQADSEDSCLTARMSIWAVWCACWSESLLYACVIYRLVVP